MKYWKEIEEDLFVIRAEGLEDFRAVVGAKTSRATDLNIKADIDSSGIDKFLSLNLAGYGHASIGEMAFPSIHHRGIGWIAAWLVEDDPLFVGQEVSTRAVNVKNISNGSIPCYDSPKGLEKSHDLFWSIFEELDRKNELDKGYKFDYIRWAMPGTSRVGVTSMMNARVAMRHLERLESLPFMSKCVDNFFKGIREAAPFVFESLRKGPRRAFKRWTDIGSVEVNKSKLDLSNSISIEPPFDLEKNISRVKIDNRGDKDYLDPAFNSLGMFKVNIICSIAAARDWHRHRPVMPWNIRLVTDESNPFIVPWYDTSGYDREIKKIIEENFEITKDINSIQKLYSLPYGAAVEIECYGTLPSILYMLELRSSAGGSNFEYASHAEEGLKKLIDILGSDFVKNHSIDRTLKN